MNRIVNYPEDLSEFTRFQDALFGLCGCNVEGQFEKPKPYGPELKRDETINLQGLAATKAAELALLPVGDDKNPSGYQVCGKAQGVSLFIVRKGTSDNAAVAVEYEGETYSIPKGTHLDKSTHVLSLLTQILGLQNKGADLPSTANVRLVQ